jgi:hypothetical protein
MDWLFNEVKRFIAELPRLFVNERVNDYRSSFFRYQDMMMQVTLDMDRALMTFSIAALAALAALNEKVFIEFGWLSYATLLCFIGVVITVIAGYYFSKGMIVDAQRIISANFKKSLATPLGEGINKVKFRKITKVIDTASTILFITGMVLFMILMALYIREV